jgi:catechol 2,3-dioxygenase-like lactoylglutathione lyase family enzyme
VNETGGQDAIEAIDHVQLAMPAGGEEQARNFYCGILGLPEREKPPLLARRGGVWFESAKLKLHLGVDPHFVPAKKAHVAFLARSFQPIVQRLRGGGFPVIDDDAIDGVVRVYTEDPFGNRLELIDLSAAT